MIEYKHFIPESVLPKMVIQEPYKAVVLVEENCSNDWRNQLSDWLVLTGCKYMCAWGIDCSVWDDAVDYACIEHKGVSAEELVMTTWHENESIKEVFQFVKNDAAHDYYPNLKTVIIHISAASNEKEVVHEFSFA